MAIHTISLFSGYAGIELGLELAGKACGFQTRTVCYVEREAFAAANLVAKMEQGWLDQAPVWSDVTTFDSDPWRGKVDCITGGFPCQPWSNAGQRKGTEDERWLWPDIARLVRSIRPGLVFLENVPGLLSGGLEHVLGDLASLGYDAEWEVFSAEQLGATHRRERVFVLAHRTGFNAKTSCKRNHRSTEEWGGASGHEFNRNGPEVAHTASRGCGQDEQSCTGNGSVKPEQHCERRPLPVFPPGPAARERWGQILEEFPQVEPAVCGVVDGRTSRVDELRTLGNGVVPVVAGYAFVTLARRAGVEIVENL